jgi:hypothetical protein
MGLRAGPGTVRELFRYRAGFTGGSTALRTVVRTCDKTLFACRFLTVDADVEHNKSVLSFYEKNGFLINEALFNKERKNVSMRKDIYF